MLYMVSPAYATTFENLYALYLFYGIAIGPARRLRTVTMAHRSPQPMARTGMGWTIYAANPVMIPLGNQNTYSNFNVYSDEGSTTGTALGADTCFYFSAEWNDQTGGYLDVGSLDHFKNLYCENENGPHDVQMPLWGVGTR